MIKSTTFFEVYASKLMVIICQLASSAYLQLKYIVFSLASLIQAETSYLETWIQVNQCDVTICPNNIKHCNDLIAATWSSYRIVPALHFLSEELLPLKTPLHSGSVHRVWVVRDVFLLFPPSGVFFSFGMYQAGLGAKAKDEGKSFRLHNSAFQLCWVYTAASACCCCCFYGKNVIQQMLEWAHALNGFMACLSVASHSAVISSDEKSWFVEPGAK